jgi:hypothetical protein
MGLEDWALRLTRDLDMKSEEQSVLSAPPVCAQCQARLLGTWKCCPYCGVHRSQNHEIDRPMHRGAAVRGI